MSLPMVLDSDELESLTGKVRASSQVKALRFMGIEHRTRPDGTVAVLRVHVEQVLGVLPAEKRKPPANEPNWSAI